MDQINFANILPAEIWKMIISFLLHEPGQGWPPSVWRVRRLLWPVAMADFDSLLCVTSRAFLATTYETVVKKCPILTKLLTPLALVDAGEKGKNEADMIRIKEALEIFFRARTLDYILGDDTTEGSCVCFFSDLGSCGGNAYIKVPSEIAESPPKNWRQIYRAYYCSSVRQSDKSSVSRIPVDLCLRCDPFRRPFLWAEAGLSHWCRLKMPDRFCVLKAVSNFSLRIAQLANRIHGNMELCLFACVSESPMEEGSEKSGLPFPKESIFLSGRISHPVTQDSALIIARVLGESTESDRGHFRHLGNLTCNLGARIYCTDEHETPMGYGWAVSLNEETPRWVLNDPYKDKTCLSFRLLTQDELTVTEKEAFQTLPPEHHPIGMLTSITIVDTEDDDEGKPPPKKRAKLQ